jgi:hypothetical protein
MLSLHLFSRQTTISEVVYIYNGISALSTVIMYICTSLYVSINIQRVQCRHTVVGNTVTTSAANTVIVYICGYMVCKHSTQHKQI